MPGANDRDIDELYQLPLDEFTGARNVLAKSSGDGSVKKLEKPNLAAWAVNQLYWRHRKIYDELIKTSGQLRTAHQQLLAGTSIDLRAPEAFHAEAMRKAKAAIRGLLESAGHSVADSVMTPVTETLDALPTADAPGRLTRPLRRTGFEALQGVTIAARPARPAAPGAEPSRAPATGSERDRKQREADQQELAMARERLRFAEAARREAEASLERARRTLDRAERTRERIEGELAEAVAAEKAARKEVASSESSLQKAKTDAARLRKSLG